MTCPIISVILPVYNAEAYLHDVLAAVLGQEEETLLEVLAIDDGSSDGSLGILHEVAKKDARLIVLTQKNSGPSQARNLGLSQARGEWLAFTDADDWLDKRTFATWLRQAQREDCDLLIGNGFSFVTKPLPDLENGILVREQPWGRTLSGAAWIEHCVKAEEWPHYVWLQFVRRDLVEKHSLRFCPGIVHEDIVWTLHLALAAERIGFCQEPLYGYRDTPTSIMHSLSEKTICQRAEGYLEVLDEIVAVAQKCSHPPLRRALLRYANQEAGHFLGLVRKRIQTPQTRVTLAREFLRRGLPSTLIRNARSLHELWRAMRCWLLLRKIARRSS